MNSNTKWWRHLQNKKHFIKDKYISSWRRKAKKRLPSFIYTGNETGDFIIGPADIRKIVSDNGEYEKWKTLYIQ